MTTSTVSLSENINFDGNAERAKTCADEKFAPTSTSADHYATSEGKSGDETSVDEKEDNYVTPESISGDEISVDEKDVPERSTQEEEEEEECGFCLFMKAGPCGVEFKQWQECVEGAEKSEKDIVEQCAQMTTLLKVCMEANPQYYGPVLDAEKAMQADINSSEKTSMDGSKSSDPPAGDGVDSEIGEQTVETVETLHTVVNHEGHVLEVTDNVELDFEEQTVETVETLHVVENDQGEVVEVVDVLERIDDVESEDGKQTADTVETLHGLVNDEEVVEGVDLAEVDVRALQEGSY